MNDYRNIIAANLVELRTERKMTQLQLAQILNYSDKAISKWERGESVPDIAVLKQIADLFGVTVDYLLAQEHSPQEIAQREHTASQGRNKRIITALSVSLVWLIATFLFVVFRLAQIPEDVFKPWLLFVYPVPVSFLLLLIFNSVWGNRKWNYFFISSMIWTVLAVIYLSLLLMLGIPEIWLVFVLGIPAQIIVLLWSGIIKRPAPTPHES